MGDEELKATIRIPAQPLDLKQFTDLLNRYNEDEHKDPEEPYRRAFMSINKDASGHVSSQELRVALDGFLGPNVFSEVIHFSFFILCKKEQEETKKKVGERYDAVIWKISARSMGKNPPLQRVEGRMGLAHSLTF